MLTAEYNLPNWERPNVIEDLKQRAKLMDDVEKILSTDRSTALLAKKTPGQLTKYFPVDTKYSLQKSSDGVVLQVLSPWGIEDSMDAIYRFDEEWWLDNMPRTADGLTVEVLSS